MLKLKSILLLVLMVVFLAGCGGGGGGDDGDSSMDKSSEKDTQELAAAAKETSSQILAAESDAALFKNSGASFSAVDFLKNSLGLSSDKFLSAVPDSNSLAKALVSETQSGSEPGSCGGSAGYTLTMIYDDPNVYPFTWDYDYVFDDYCQDVSSYEIVYNGSLTMYMHHSDAHNGYYDYTYDLSYTSDMPFHYSGSLYYSERCQLEDDVETCSIGVYETETTTYYTSEVDVSGDASSGYDVSYVITDGDGNVYNVDFAGLKLCDNGNIGAGGGTLTYNGDQVISIEFISCDEYTVTHDGTTETYQQ